MKPLVSLVIPVYNVEKYFAKCMETVLSQTYPNFEVILVDDGSTDSCGQMCDAYAEQNPRVRVFHKLNGGLSDARNFGVERAKGDLISFIDSDDYVAENYVEYLYNLMESNNADISCGNRYIVEDGKVRAALKYAEGVLNTEEGMISVCKGSAAWARLYKKEMLLKYPYPTGCIYEDLATTYKIIGECQTIAYGSEPIYYYIQRSGSIKASKFDERHFYFFEAAEARMNYFRERFPNIVPIAERYYVSEAFALIATTGLFYDSVHARENFARIRERLLPYIKAVLSNPSAPIYLKTMCVAVMVGFYPAKFIWPIRMRIRRILKGF